MAVTNDTQHRRAIIGNGDNLWRYSSKTGFDLTHPPNPSSPPVSPSVTVETTTEAITIDPAKSALVIIDMQNFFVSAALGRAKGAGHSAVDELVQYAIPACRKAGIRVVWLNWGLTDKEVECMPLAVKRAFGFVAVAEDDTDEGFGVDKHGNPAHQGGHAVLENGKEKRVHKGLGSEMGIIKDPETGEDVDAGRMLMRESWNAALCPPLDGMYEEGTKLESRPDIWIHKNRMSGMWGPRTECEEFLEKEGLKTLFFSGVNTDQCVGGTYQDCFSKGYDCVLLGDGAGTTSPEYAQQCFEYNAAHTWGFLTSCQKLAEGVGRMSQ